MILNNLLKKYKKYKKHKKYKKYKKFIKSLLNLIHQNNNIPKISISKINLNLSHNKIISKKL
jgi:ribosomal protein L18E